MKIAFFEINRDEGREIFEEALAGADAVFFEEKLSNSNIDQIKDAEGLCISTDSILNQEAINALPNLKFIITRTTGFNQIDCEYADSRGIKVSNVPAYGSRTVAEFTFALLLTLSRKMREAGKVLKEEGYFLVPQEVEGFDLHGKTLGVIGTGRIGKNVIAIARGFGMNISAYDLYPDLKFAEENNFSYKTFDEVLRESDIITLHAPSTKENFHLINKDSVSKMKKGAYLLNTARGDIVETEALIWGLEEGIIAGAGLDVLEGEAGFKKGDIIPMLQMPNVIITPHVAFDTREAKERILQTTIENLKSAMSGNPLNLVN